MNERRNEFEKQGYIVVPNLLKPHELAELSRMADRLLDGELKPDLAYDSDLPADFYTFWEPSMKERGDLPRRMRVRLMSWMCYHHSWFWDFARHPSIAGLISDLFGGGDIKIFSDTVFMKPPRHGIAAAPHQDTAFWPKLSPNAILFWLAIDPATIENGCLWIVPGSHRHDLPHESDPVMGRMLHDEQFDTSKQIPIELAPGSAVIMDSGTIHRSYPNRSDHSRRAMTSDYVAGNVQHVEPWTQKYKFKEIDAASPAATAQRRGAGLEDCGRLNRSSNASRVSAHNKPSQIT